MAQVSVIITTMPAGFLLLTPSTTAQHFREWFAASAKLYRPVVSLCGIRSRIIREYRLMKNSARAVVIGGGVVGASTLYHLAKIGWTDVMLIEKSELTSGSTWHAAGGMHTFNGEANISRLQKYTIDLYREIEALSGQSCGLHPNGGLMLAATQGELDSLKLICSRARYLGMETEMISLEEAQALQSADRHQLFHRRALAGGRRPLRSLGHDACLRQGGAHARRLGRALHARARAHAAHATDPGTS